MQKKYLKFGWFLFVLSVALTVISCGDPAPNKPVTNANSANVAGNSANSLNSNQFNNVQTKIAKPQDPVMTNLTESIHSWIPEQEYSVSSKLIYVWVKGGNHPWDYSSKGAKKLISNIQSNNLFKDCSQAKNLKVKMFEPTGEIQTVGNLYDELYFCDSNNQ